MNFVFNSPTLPYMRQIKDSLSREEFNNISKESIEKLRNREAGIGQMVLDIVNFVKEKKYPILTLNEIYNQIIN